MRKCPFCLQEIPEEAKVCKHCGKTVVKRCPSCNEEIVATAALCRFCKADTSGKPPPLRVEATIVNDAPCGERRDILATVLLTIVTCGFYGMYLQYKMGSEINRHHPKSQLNPGLDLLLLFLTCGLWGWYVMYRYPREVEEMIRSEGGTPGDITIPCLLFAFFGLHLVSFMVLQGELNKHWETHNLPQG